MKLFLQINFLIAAAYLLMAALSRLSSAVLKANPLSQAQDGVRLAQTILLATLLAPLAVSVLPTRSLPHISYEVVAPLPEGVVRKARVWVNPHPKMPSSP